MNLRWAALLVLPIVAAPALQAVAPRANRLEIGGIPYQFHPLKLVLSTPTAQLKGNRMLRLSGRLVPAVGEAIALDLMASETGFLYLLTLTRPRGQGQDVWAATMKTRVEVLDLQAKSGGRLHLRLSGPLAATLGSGGSFTQWSGDIQARFNGISE